MADGRDDEWEGLEEQLREEPLFTTPLDKHDPYVTFTEVFTRNASFKMHLVDNVEMEKVNPAQVNAITSSLTPDEQKLLQSIVEQAKINLAEQEQAPALHLNGN